VSAEFTSGGSDCPEGTQAEVATTKTDAYTPLPFYIVFY
jgi:hypothetical protein